MLKSDKLEGINNTSTAQWEEVENVKQSILQERREEERDWKTYFGALRRERNVGFRRGRGEECVPVVWRTHVHSLPGGAVMKRWNEKREEKKEKV